MSKGIPYELTPKGIVATNKGNQMNQADDMYGPETQSLDPTAPNYVDPTPQEEYNVEMPGEYTSYPTNTLTLSAGPTDQEIRMFALNEANTAFKNFEDSTLTINVAKKFEQYIRTGE